MKDTFQHLRQAYPGSRLLIVSNTAGTPGERHKAEATILERNTGVKVLHHNTKVGTTISSFTRFCQYLRLAKQS